MIKASSMAYAIFIFVIVGICCYAFILLSGVSQLHQTIIKSQKELISTNESATNYFLSVASTLDEVALNRDVLNNGMSSDARIWDWGAFKILEVRSHFKQDTVKRSFLIGQAQSKRIALYLPSNGKILHLADRASISGDVFVPKKELKVGYIGSNAYKKLAFDQGSISTSNLRLPKLRMDFNPKINGIKIINLDTADARIPIYNSFTDETLICTTSRSQLANFSIKGNIKIVARDSLFIRSSCDLADVLIQSPKLVFESNFKGSAQIFAKERVTLKRNAQLYYPSSIYLSNDQDLKIELKMESGSKILGGIVIDDEEYVGNLSRLMIIEKEAMVVGDVYCNGSIDLKGKVIGSVYTDRFYLKTEASTYENYIRDGSINAKEIPDYFIGLPLFETSINEHHKYEIIKTL